MNRPQAPLCSSLSILSASVSALQVEAFRSNVVCPNKHTDGADRLYKGRLLATETYIGGKVEALESGIFRSDLPCQFRMQPDAYQGLIDRCAGTQGIARAACGRERLASELMLLIIQWMALACCCQRAFDHHVNAHAASLIAQ